METKFCNENDIDIENFKIDESFEEMLDRFIASEMEDEETEETEENETEEVKDSVEPEKETEEEKRIRVGLEKADLTGSENWDDEDWDDAVWETMEDEELEKFYPSGEFEQNNNLTMKVEILRPSKNPRGDLEQLVGCEDLKQRMEELIALSRFNKIMRRAYPKKKKHKLSLHSIFYGRPGTGKTTVCRIFGGLLKQAGILRLGHVVVCDRATFIGSLWGDEERSVNSVLEKAQDGVLMIDEAYTLYGDNEKDPGRNVLQQMMTTLADESKRNIAVVLCGYKEPMEKMLNSNPGLESRFPNRFEFKDFTFDQLLEITLQRVKEYGYKFSKAGWKKYQEVLYRAYKMRNPEKWGNARFVANQLERIYLHHAVRCTNEKVGRRALLIITEEDIVPIEVARATRRIGF